MSQHIPMIFPLYIYIYVGYIPSILIHVPLVIHNYPMYPMDL